jgi:hypothetical protein
VVFSGVLAHVNLRFLSVLQICNLGVWCNSGPPESNPFQFGTGRSRGGPPPSSCNVHVGFGPTAMTLLEFLPPLPVGFAISDQALF